MSSPAIPLVRSRRPYRDFFSVSPATFRNKHFWVILALVAFIAGAHSLMEFGSLLPHWSVLWFVPTTAFLIPVTYAALTFGLKGALSTAILCTIVSVPNWVLFHTGVGRLACIFQLVVVDAAAYFVGQRVERERQAWRRVARIRGALNASETQYHSLFESSPVAILQLDESGAVTDANPTAEVLFDRSPRSMKGTNVADLIGSEAAMRILGDSTAEYWQTAPLTIGKSSGARHDLKPVLTRVTDEQGSKTIQVVFGDVTAERRNQAGLRAYAAHLLNTLEVERQRIARELHDQTIQQLVLVCRQMENVDEMNGPLTATDATRLKDARKTAEDGVKWLRDFIRTLRPPILDDLGIGASIRRLLADFKERTGTEARFKIAGGVERLSPDKELNLFRIAQEAIWNIEHHASASRVEVGLTFGQRRVSLEVMDNGVGFAVLPEPTDFTAGGHFGLLGMQERAASMGGSLEVRSAPKGGTRLRVVVPV